MKQYKLVNKVTSEEHICSKVVVDGFDYYVTGTPDKDYEGHYIVHNKLFHTSKTLLQSGCKKVIATNNPKIDISQVIDEVDLLAKLQVEKEGWGKYEGTSEQVGIKNSFTEGYNKSQKANPNSDLDMIEFGKWRLTYENNFPNSETTKELLKLWKDKQIKKLQTK